MSKYTFELGRCIDFTSKSEVLSWFMDYDLNDYLTQKQIEVVNNANLFNKSKLANYILDYYFKREIGYETIGLFKMKVKNKMNLLMEKYAPLIYSNSIDYDILVNEDYTESFTRNINNQNSGQSNSTQNANGLTYNSITPQGQVNKTNILNGNYAHDTSAGESETSANTSASSNDDTNETYTRKVKGNRGISATYQAMIKQYRENIITIYNDIINDLNDMFMGIY